MEEIAELKAKSQKKKSHMKKEFSDLEAISDEDELPFEKRDLWQKKWYMDITRLSKRGDI